MKKIKIDKNIAGYIYEPSKGESFMDALRDIFDLCPYCGELNCKKFKKGNFGACYKKGRRIEEDDGWDESFKETNEQFIKRMETEYVR